MGVTDHGDRDRQLAKEINPRDQRFLPGKKPEDVPITRAAYKNAFAVPGKVYSVYYKICVEKGVRDNRLGKVIPEKRKPTRKGLSIARFMVSYVP